MKLMIDIPKNLYKATINGLDANEIWDLRLSVKNGTPLEQEPCEDCISKQTVLDMMQMKMSGKELYKAVYDLPNVQPKTEPCDCISRDMALEKMADYVSSGYADSVEDFEEYSKIICQLPSVQPKTEWISVSERLPEKNDIYVVWTSKGFGNHLSTSYYSVDDGWTIEVCAWKENGEPYKAESEVQDE